MAKCVKVHDGDTIHVVFKMHGELVRFKCRMLGYDSPELTSKIDAEREAAIVARDALARLILNKKIICRCGKFDKYGRLLVVVYLHTSGRKDINVNDWMRMGGYGVEYLC